MTTPPKLTRSALVQALCECSDQLPPDTEIDTSAPVRQLDVMRATAFLEKLRQWVEQGVNNDNGQP